MTIHTQCFGTGAVLEHNFTAILASPGHNGLGIAACTAKTQTNRNKINMKPNVNRLSYIEYSILHVISFIAAAIEFNLSRQRNLQLAARRVLPQLNLICGSFCSLLCIVAPKVRVMLMARSRLPLQLRRLWLRFSCMQRG